VLHTHGRHGHDPPQRHLIATRGGYAGQGQRGAHFHSLPYERLRRTWQWYLRGMVRQRRQTEVVNQVVEEGFTRSPKGLVPNVPKGQVPSP
jgi:hypothetical protein